jgi:NAD(P)-dependent dehydrogenase (short-subunit alcohol dehydrogenase family)
MTDPQSKWVLDGKRALVTGAAVGIGQGIAVELARRGANVVVHHAGSDPAETLSKIAEEGKEGVSVQADLNRPEECERLVADASERLDGGLDILINNSGVSIEEPIEDMGADKFDTLFNINVRSAYLCTRAALPMLADGGGSVLNLSSASSFAGFPPSALYSATKGAINSMTRTLAMELVDRKVRVNAIAPGLVEVPRLFTQNRSQPYDSDEAQGWIPWGRVGTPEDIGSMAAFLSSDAADFVTGQVIFVDGGTTSLLGVMQR